MGAQPCPVWEQGKRRLCQTRIWFHHHDLSPVGKSISQQVGDTTPLDEIPFPRTKHMPAARALARHQQNHFCSASGNENRLFLTQNLKLPLIPGCLPCC